MLVERCSLSATGPSKSLALGLFVGAKSCHPARPGATSATKIVPKSNQNQSKIGPKSILGDRGVPGSIQERLKKQPGRTQNGQGRVRDAPGALSGRPGVLQDSPSTFQERCRDAPEVHLERPKTLVKCVRVADSMLNAFQDLRRTILDRFGFDAQQLRSAFRIGFYNVFSMLDVLRIEHSCHAKTSKNERFVLENRGPGHPGEAWTSRFERQNDQVGRQSALEAARSSRSKADRAGQGEPGRSAARPSRDAPPSS